ncbi:MAG: flagellar hook-basal body complex protein FliE [Spirochaetes bacterium]|jgi:flagellar hook-basal body complex protein FliE|nr:flagellar hook-basal body complex protein FliE [Brevinematales bacterium]MCL1960041.1 flagellar hook-basal body complex protein FliE [Spirochaetota bacterium]
MEIFNNNSYISSAAAKNYATEMLRTHPKHMLPPDSPYFGSGNKIIALEKKISAEHVTGAGTFEHAMLQALDKVSGAQQHVSELEKEAIINPDSVDIHDITIAQAEASMALNITRNVLNRLVQGWRDIINTR